MISYSEHINNSIGKVYQAGIATKILQYMDRVRNVSDLAQERRWSMELIQNSRDCAYPDQDVSIQVILKKNELIYRHNGKPFRTKDILSIINQVSSKGDDKDTVGKFGTGFMTTFLLSPEVEIESVLKEEGLAPKRFRICLDRSGTTQEEILSDNTKNIELLKRVDDSEDITDFDKLAYNTTFTYRLTSDYFYQIARTGMEDLQNSVLYILLFSNRIRKIEICFEESGRSMCYERSEKGGEPVNGSEQLKCLKIMQNISEEGKEEVREHSMVYIEEEGMTLASEIDPNGSFCRIPDILPRIFVDFPLIGAEHFPFPVIVNDRGFKVNEPRSGITLVDNENSVDAKINKELMEKAVRMYERYVSLAAGCEYGGLENIVEIPAWIPDREMSENWVTQHIYIALYSVVSGTKMINTTEGLRALSEDGVFLPCAQSPEEKGKLSKLLGSLKGVSVPAGVERWLEAFSGYSQHKEKTRSLSDLAEKAGELLREKVDENKISRLDWLQLLYNACLENEELEIGISAGRLSILPNQCPESLEKGELCSLRNIYRDTDIPEVFKDITEYLDELSGSDKLKLRSCLIRKDFQIGSMNVNGYPVSALTSYISQRADRNYRVVNYSLYSQKYLKAWDNAWRLMISAGPDETFYKMTEAIWQDIPKYQPLTDSRFESSIWRSSYASVLREFCDAVEMAGSISNWINMNKGLSGEQEGIEWINSLIECVCSWHNKYSGKIYPNQKGEFCNCTVLLKDDMEFKELKEIEECFSDKNDNCRVFEKLLDSRIKKTHMYISSYTDKDSAIKIGSVISELLAEGSLSLAKPLHQEACTRLLAWIREHVSKAMQLFPSYARDEDQMKLLTPGAAAKIQKKADDYTTLLKELGEENIEAAMKKIHRLKEKEEGEDHNTCGGRYFEGGDVFFGSDMQGLNDDELRQIGIEGERYAFSELRRTLLENGFAIEVESVDRRNVKLVRTTEDGEVQRAELTLADYEDHHQAGYDILFTSWRGEEKPIDHYYEVKTHTPSSQFLGTIRLSNEQMKLAAAVGDRFCLLEVVYDNRFRKGISVTELPDPVHLIGEGRIRNMEKYYHFKRVSGI